MLGDSKPRTVVGDQMHKFVVALPEELFFRGMLLRLLEQRFPPKRRFLGGGIGVALVLSAAAFALIHLPKDGDPRAAFAILAADEQGHVRASIERVPYDAKAVAREVAAAGLPGEYAEKLLAAA